MIESKGSDEKELGAISEKPTVYAGQIGFVVLPQTIILDSSFAIIENTLTKSLIIHVTAVISDLTDVWIVFLPVADPACIQ